MRDLEPRIREKDARVVVVGSGAPAFIGPFRQATGFKGEILTDPTRGAYEAAGLVRSALAMVSPRAALAGMRAFQAGFRMDGIQGDAWQQGGILVVRKTGELAYRYASRFSGDHPDPEAFLRAL